MSLYFRSSLIENNTATVFCDQGWVFDQSEYVSTINMKVQTIATINSHFILKTYVLSALIINREYWVT